MIQLMFNTLLLHSTFSTTHNSDSIEISMVPSMDDGPISWKQTVIISCSWTPGDKMDGDILVGDGRSVWSDDLYGKIVNLEDSKERIFFTSNDTAGVASLTIKNVTAKDARTFACSVSRKGSSDSITLRILEPPLTGVKDLVAVPGFTSVTLTWSAVSGATNYSVGWRSVGSGDWTMVNVRTTSHKFKGLSVASKFEAKIDAANRAGIREGIEPAEVTFTTKDNRPPHPVGGLGVKETSYNQTNITLTWNLQENRVEGRTVTNILVSAEREGRKEEVLLTRTLRGVATSTTVQLPGPGTFFFNVTTLNDYSAGVDTTRFVSHMVKETTDPPTKPATDPPKPPTDPPKDPSTDPPPELPPQKNTTKKVTTKPERVTYKPDEGKQVPVVVETGEHVKCGPNLHIKLNAGRSLQLICVVPDGAQYSVEQISWTHKAGEGPVVSQDEIISKGVSVESNVSTSVSTLQIQDFVENLTGTWTCTESLHSSKCPYQITLDTSSSGSPGLSVFTILSLVLYFIFLV